MNNENIRISSLDAIRGFAAIGVAFFWHYQHLKPEHYPFSEKAYWFYNYGWSLVDLFFILSGFIFSYVYKETISNKKISFNQYSILRLSRLYPLHLITLFFVAIFQAIRYFLNQDFFVYQYNDFYHFLMNIFFLQYGWFESGYSFNAPSWSVAVEIIAYILFFVILYRFREKYIYLFISLIFIGLSINHLNIQIPLFNDSTSRVFIGFFIGCLVFEINKQINKSSKKILFVSLLSIIFISVISGATLIGHEFLGNWPIVYTIFIYPSMILLILNIKILNNILSLKPFAYLGEVSYSIYLWHFPVQLLVKTLDDVFSLNINFSSRFIFIGIVIITILISILSYEFIEKPTNKFFRKRFLKRRNNYSDNSPLT